ncbi:CAP domain-containing protein [Luteimicrobium sp. NPDC057192]|uniref:CAP domain-containing protein n=1 Tax=Luteimicrobium sp. NPDC057192 TaxID=3346042 RepID=UPI00362F87C2
MAGAPGVTGRRVGLAVTLFLAGLACLATAGVLIARSDIGDSPSGTTPTAAAPTPSDPAQYARDLVSAANARRHDAGLARLTASSCARDAAKRRAEALVGTAPLTHAPLAPVTETCTASRTAAENLARAESDPVQVVDAWMGSAGHRQNILDPAFGSVGASCAKDGAAMLCSMVFLGS